MRKETTTTTADAAPPSSPQDTNNDVAAMMAFLSEWNEEIVQFYVSRYQQYWSLPMQLQSCSSLDDLRALQQDFQATLFDDYRDEAARLSRVVNAARKDLEPQQGTDYEAELLKAQQDAAAIIEQAKVQAERILASAREQAEAPAEAVAAAEAAAAAKETPARKRA